MKTTYFLLLAFVMLTSCANKTAQYSDMYAFQKDENARTEISKSPPPPPTGGIAGAEKPREADEKFATNTIVSENKTTEKIKKTGNVTITVDDYKKARIEIEKIIKAGNAYIGSENEQNSTYGITNTMVIRVANKDFDSMINQLLAVGGNVNSKNIFVEDVTAQFIDIQSRLKSKKEIENRYLEILQKASKVSDILEIQKKLGEIREEIEAKEGELKYLSDQVNYSTINLNFHQEYEYTPSDRPGFFGRLGNAFGNGWAGFLSFLIALIYTWPLWIILGLGTYFIIRLVKRKTKKQ